MKTFILGLMILIPFTSEAQSVVDILHTQSQNETKQESPQLRLDSVASARTEFDFRKIPTNQDLLERYIKMGGDVSGGGFGLKIKNSEKVILHDLWCGNKNYQFNASDITSEDGRAEITLALSRTALWKSTAPALMIEIEKIIKDPTRWQLTTRPLKLNPLENFEFPGTPAELLEFHKTFEEAQAAEVNRHTGVILLNSNLWSHMDLQSRAGLMIHEALRLIYIRSVKGYLVPGILQWMTGTIMLYTPDYPLTQRLIESFYEELIVTTDNTAVADKQRPADWRLSLCKQRNEVVRNVKSILGKTDFVKTENSEQSLKSLCGLQDAAVKAHQARTPWMNLGFNIEMLSSPCAEQDLKKVSSYTLTYWMQKHLGIGHSWEKPSQPQVTFDITYLLAQHPTTLTTANYQTVMTRFLESGDKYCLKRSDYYGSGEEFLALGDILLETLVRASKK